MIRHISILLVFATFISPAVTIYAKEKPIKMHIEEMRSVNKSRLVKLSIGMSEKEVLAIMGTRTFYHRKPKRLINNPYRVESRRTKEGKVLRIFFYYTDIKKADDTITDDELTPLLLEDGKLVG